MVPRILLLKVAIALVAVACAVSPRPTKPQPVETTRLCYTSIDGRTVHGSLVRQQMTSSAGSTRRPDGERLIGVTELDGGEMVRLVEDVTLDAHGALRRAEAVLTQGGLQTLRVVLDPGRGVVDLTTTGAAGARHWNVPTDLPWVWAPILTLPSAGGSSARSSGGGIATAAGARATWRAAADGRPVRLLDLANLVSHTITADQLRVPDQTDDLGAGAGAGAVDPDKGVVVLGDDAIDIEAGMPTRLHLAALGVNVEPMDAKGLSGKLVASSRCPSASGLSTP